MTTRSDPAAAGPAACDAAVENLPDVRVKDIPDTVAGSTYRFGVCRGTTVAMARMAGGRGRCAASLWQAQGHGAGWWVRTEDDQLHEFGEETDAVRFFVTYLRRLSNSAV